MTYGSTGEYSASVSDFGKVIIRSVETGQESISFLLNHDFLNLAFSPDCAMLAAALNDNSIRIWTV